MTDGMSRKGKSGDRVADVVSHENIVYSKWIKLDGQNIG